MFTLIIEEIFFLSFCARLDCNRLRNVQAACFFFGYKLQLYIMRLQQQLRDDELKR